MKLNYLGKDINKKILNIVQDIIPNIDTKGEYSLYPENKTGRDWKYNTSKEYLNKNKKLIEATKEKYPPVYQYLLSFEQKLIPNNLTSLVQELYPNKKINISGHWYYPNQGYIGWHTNCDRPSKRLYITYASENKKSFFRYLKNKEVITCYDNKGITIREFDIPEMPEFFWHCVGSECDRYSFGFKITNIS